MMLISIQLIQVIYNNCSISHKIYTVLLCLVFLWLFLDPCDQFTFIIQGCFTGTGAIIWLPQWYDCPSASEATLKNMGKIGQYLTTARHHKQSYDFKASHHWLCAEILPSWRFSTQRASNTENVLMGFHYHAETLSGAVAVGKKTNRLRFHVSHPQRLMSAGKALTGTTLGFGSLSNKMS